MHCHVLPFFKKWRFDVFYGSVSAHSSLGWRDYPVWHFAMAASLHCCSVYMQITVGSTFVTELGHCITTNNYLEMTETQNNDRKLRKMSCAVEYPPVLFICYSVSRWIGESFSLFCITHWTFLLQEGGFGAGSMSAFPPCLHGFPPFQGVQAKDMHVG